MQPNIEGIDSPIYNSRIIDTYIKLVKRRYPHVSMADLLEYAGITQYEISDQGHWFSQRQIDLFYERLVHLTGNEHIAREAGQYAASPEASGVMRKFFLGLVGPLKAYEMIGKGAVNFTRSAIYEARRLGDNKVEVTVTPRPGITERPFQCENRIGFLEAILKLFTPDLPEVLHPECMFKGGDRCRYVLSWKRTKSDIWKRIRNYAVCLLVVGFASIFSCFRSLPLMWPAVLSFGLVLALSWQVRRLEVKELNAAISNLQDSTDKLLEQINLNYNNILITNEVSQAVNRYAQLDQILTNVVQILEKRLNYDRGMILLANRQKTSLQFRSGYGYTNEVESLLLKTSFHLDRPESKGIFVISFREQKPFLVNQFDEISADLSPNSLAFARKMGAQSFIVCPIVCEGEPLGILAVDNIVTKKPLINTDRSLLTGIASVVGMSIRNAMLNEAKEQQFNSTLQVLAASIDARDALTAGHAEKVTRYAVGICRELDLEKDYCEMIRVAALLHDYGKIGIPDSILKKEGRLTEDEYNQVKFHVTKTREILQQINFEGIYRQVPEIAGSHHEKIDGSGYPRGLYGHEIPLGAKIIAVADFFEAITAKRHYRDPMKLEDAVRLLEEHSGTYFEKRVVRAFLAFMEKSPDFVAEKAKGPFPVYSLRKRRAPCRVPVSMKIGDKSLTGFSRDISAGGMYVAVDGEVVNDGVPVELSFALPGIGAVSVTAKGRVVWVNSAGSPKKPSFPAGFGVEFQDVKPSEEIVQAFVKSFRVSVVDGLDGQAHEQGPIYSAAGDVPK